MTTTIYVLKLDGDKYYVGRTCNYVQRIDAHFFGQGSEWTRIHPPLSVTLKKETNSLFEEDKVVKEMMSLYGINNVRGGSYVRVNLTPSEKKFLKREIDMAKDICLSCGSDKHFINECDVEEVVYECEVCGQQFSEEDKCEYHVINCVDTRNIGTQTRDIESQQEQEIIKPQKKLCERCTIM
jgi:hypothetical protein